MNKLIWSSGGMILTGENWSTGRKTLYRVGGRWMNEYGAMVEWYWQRKTEVLGEKHYTVWVKMNKLIWSNDGMILTGENWSTGRKTLYRVGGRWMNEYGAMVEWYWQRKTEVLGEKHYTVWVKMNKLIWSNGGMILTGEKWSTGRKTLYRVGGRWMNEYGAMVEWSWQRKIEALGEKHYTAWVIDE